MKKVIAVVVLLTLALSVVAFSQERNEVAKGTKFAEGAIVSVVPSTASGSALYLNDAELRKVGDTWFVTGKMLDIPEFPASSRIGRAWISLQNVSVMIEYKDVEELRKVFSEQPSPQS